MMVTSGHGSFSTVKTAREKLTGKTFAVKIVDKHKVKPETLQLIRGEVQILKKVDNHPNIVHFVDFFEGEDVYYVVMECIRGGELQQQILKEKHIDEVKSKRLIKEAVEAVKFCHDREIVHR
jgi:serine/threonine protein kinase